MVNQSDFSSASTPVLNNNVSNNQQTSSNKNWLGLVMLAATFFLFGIAPVFILNIAKDILKNNLPKPKTIQNKCFSFDFYAGAKDDIGQNEKCNVNISSSRGTVMIKLLEISGVTESNLKEIADLDKKNLVETNPSIKIESEGITKFVGLPAYQYVAKNQSRKIIVNFIYSRNTTISKVYVVGFNLADLNSPLRKEVERSWKWLEDGYKYPTPIKGSNLGVFNTPCYSIQVKTAVKEKYKINDCELSLEFQDDKSIIGIHQFADSEATLVEAVNEWKNFNKDIYIVGESNIKIGNKDGNKIIYKMTNNSDILHTIIFVYTGNVYEKSFGHSVNGFEISSLYEDNSNEKTNLDYILSHWTWL